MTTSDGSREVPPDPGQRETIVAQLADSAVLTIAALRSGKRCRLSGAPDRFDALVIEELPTEFRGYGNPFAVANLMLKLDSWGCVEVEPEDAAAVAETLSSQGGLRSRFYQSVYYELRTPVRHIAHDAVRLFGADDLGLIRSADAQLELDVSEQVLQEGMIAGAVIAGEVVARASCVARSRWARRHRRCHPRTVPG